ncbi:MAG: hypothetical protein JW774_06215 [Candidatus Aureabacteria bacterium]|nr:hypothetical protein [Candidatus Auribacterota bacterium]
MNKILKMVLPFLLSLVLTNLTAEGNDPMSPAAKGMRMKASGITPNHAKCAKCQMIKKLILDKTVLSAPDGGLFVIMGNKILKYDENLELKKEVEIKIDIEGMQKMMDEIGKKCPLCQQRKGPFISVKKAENPAGKSNQ